jgi:hypothetical protein
MISPTPLLLIMVIASTICGTIASAQVGPSPGTTKVLESKDVTGAWVTHAFRLPIDFSWSQLEATAGPPYTPVAESANTLLARPAFPGPPALPAAHAPESEWNVFAKASTDFIAPWLRAYGLECGNGTMLLHDPASGTLAVRVHEDDLPGLAGLVEGAMSGYPLNLHFTLTVVQADAASVQQCIAATISKNDHTDDFATLRADANATIAGQFLLSSRSGMRVSCAQGEPTDSGEKQSTQEGNDNSADEQSPERRTGSHVEIESTLEPDRDIYDVRAKLRFHYAPGSDPSGKIAHVADMESSLTMRKRMTRLLGVWTPEGTPANADGKLMQAAFLEGDVRPVLPPANVDLLCTVERLAPRPSPSKRPAKATAPLEIPTGMQLQRFKVPPLYFAPETMVGKGAPLAPADPFAPVDTGKPRLRPSAQRALQDGGVEFPEGAFARYNPETSTVEVVNTPENLKWVDAYIGFRPMRPATLRFTLQILEGTDKEVRGLASSTEAAYQKQDGTQADELIRQGRLKAIRTVRLEARSGARCHFTAGPTTMIGSKERAAGTSFEIDPVLGPDGQAVDLNVVLEHHYAPAEASPSASRLLNARMVSAFTMLSGTSRMVGIWKPEGAPALESRDLMQAALLRVDVVRQN